MHVQGIRRTKEDYIREQTSPVFSSNTFESLVVNVEESRARLLQTGCFRQVVAVIDKSSGWHNLKQCQMIQYTIVLDSKEPFSYDVTYITEEQRPISGGINTAVGQNEGSLVSN